MKYINFIFFYFSLNVNFSFANDNSTNNNFEDFLFVPIEGGTNQGTFVYKKFYRELLGPTSLGFGWKSIVISALPRALSSSEFDDFVINNNIIDTRENLISRDEVLCELSLATQQELSTINAVFTVNIFPPSYPKPCSLEIQFLTSGSGANDIEAKILSALSKEDGIMHIKYDYGFTAPSTTIVDMKLIVAELSNNGVLVKNDFNYFEGGIADVSYYGLALSPTFYGEKDNNSIITISAWRLFIAQMEFDGNNLKIHEDDLKTISLEMENTNKISINEVF